MAQKRTEALHEHAVGLDEQPSAAILRFLADAQVEAAKAVGDAIAQIEDAAKVVAKSVPEAARKAAARRALEADAAAQAAGVRVFDGLADAA